MGKHAKRGFTLVELMIAVALLSIGIMALAESFGFIQRAIQASKNKTIASNLVQEKMQILKQKNYYNVVPTPAAYTEYITQFTPNIPYDNYFFPPESVMEAGVSYTRYTYIEVVTEDSGEIVRLPPDTPDTGMRLLTITATWREKGEIKKMQVKSVVSNPDTVMANCALNGEVKDASTAADIEGAVVNIAENAGFRDTTDSNGNYVINVNPGDYTLSVKKTGYFQAFKSISISGGQTQTNDFNLIKMATGSVTGTPWIRDHLVISQIVGSSINAAGQYQEWVEVYNPTTWTWTMATGLGTGGGTGSNRKIIFTYQEAGGAELFPNFDYRSASVSPGSYFLFANTGTVTAAGVSKTADAVYGTDWDFNNIEDVILTGNPSSAGHLVLRDISTLTEFDVVGWDATSNGDAPKKHATRFESNAIEQSVGFQEGEEYVRKTGTTTVSAGDGRCYDSNDNEIDFVDQIPVIQIPHNSSSSELCLTGTPASGAIATCSDGLSASTQAYLTGSSPYATFELSGAATGTWTVLITSGSYAFQHDTVTVTEGGVYAFSSSATVLSNDISWGFITGSVLDGEGNAISADPISVTNYETSSPANGTTGKYTLQASSGYNTVTANPGNLNPDYVSISSQNIFVEIGRIYSGVDFILSQGSRISGFITRDGTNPLPGYTVIVLDENGSARDQQVSGTDGRFTTNIISTGTYTVTPVADSRELVSPSSAAVTLSAQGLNYFSSTFTISNAMGHITGSVSQAGEPIKTGVLIVVTTVTLSGNPPEPPELSSATLTNAPFYMVSSNENGEYDIEVRQSTNPAYNVYAYYSHPVLDACVINSSGTAGVQVLSGSTTPNIDFDW